MTANDNWLFLTIGVVRFFPAMMAIDYWLFLTIGVVRFFPAMKAGEFDFSSPSKWWSFSGHEGRMIPALLRGYYYDKTSVLPGGCCLHPDDQGRAVGECFAMSCDDKACAWECTTLSAHGLRHCTWQLSYRNDWLSFHEKYMKVHPSSIVVELNRTSILCKGFVLCTQNLSTGLGSTSKAMI